TARPDRRGWPAPWGGHAADGTADRAHPRYRGWPAAARLGDAGCPWAGTGRAPSLRCASMNIAFEGKRAIVTGAAHGFGRAIARAFAARGARVFACDINAAGLVETKALCGAACETAVVDISKQPEVESFVAQAAGGSGVDILVNNAGGVLGQVGRPLEEITPEQWQGIFNVNVTGAFYCSQAVAPGMKKAKRGRIVNISSGAGLGISLTGIQAYASAKAAQIGLTRQLAHELGPWGITVNNVAPGFVRSNPTTERQ